MTTGRLQSACDASRTCLQQTRWAVLGLVPLSGLGVFLQGLLVLHVVVGPGLGPGLGCRLVSTVVALLRTL